MAVELGSRVWFLSKNLKSEHFLYGLAININNYSSSKSAFTHYFIIA